MFDALGEALCTVLERLNEAKFASWLREQYLTAPWNCWWIGAGDYGALSSNQMARARHVWRGDTARARMCVCVCLCVCVCACVRARACVVCVRVRW